MESTLLKELHETPWETRELAIKDDQGHTLVLRGAAPDNAAVAEPTAMTRRLSSALTFFWKVVLPVIWVAGIVAGAYWFSLSRRGSPRTPSSSR